MRATDEQAFSEEQQSKEKQNIKSIISVSVKLSMLLTVK